MTKFMLDTDTVSYWLRGEGRVDRRLRSVSPSSVCVSAIVVQELELGAARARSRRLRVNLDAFYAGITVVAYDDRAARRYGLLARGLLSRGIPIGVEDTMIAAHALSLSRVVVTHNTRHFERVPGLALEDWY